ncbi:hypothetical protein Ddc_11904 [Ditylenchus destructor]|nr:hypothetical protein Ddc_11904 [Ditylenchus destructor]
MVYNLRPSKRVASMEIQRFASKKRVYSATKENKQHNSPDPSSTITPPKVHVEVLFEILHFFDRKQMCRLELVNGLFRRLINHKTFCTKPLIVLNVLEYNHECNKWTVSIERNATKTHFDIHTDFPKFLRFNFTNIYEVQSLPFDVLRSASHLWEGRQLLIRWDHRFMPTPEFGKMISLSKGCNLPLVHGSAHILPKILDGNCERVAISDSQLVPFGKLPLEDVINFLFNPSNGFRYLRIYNGTLASSRRRQTREINMQPALSQFLEMAKQRFLRTNTPLQFKFEWGHSYYAPSQWIDHQFNIRHPKINQHLRLVDASYQADTLYHKCFFLLANGPDEPI